MLKIYTVIPFFNNGEDIFEVEVKSFTNFDAAYDYAENLGRNYEIIENQLAQ